MENPQQNIADTLNLIKIYCLYFFQIVQVLFSNFILWLKLYFTGQKQIKDDIVLITGSAGYLGRHLAFEFGQKATALVLWDINEEQNKNTLKWLNSKGILNAYLFTVDITKQDRIRETARKVREQVGQVSLVIMAAAPGFKPKSILEITYTEDIEKHFKIDYLAQLWLIQEFLEPMIRNNHGHFVTISSNSALADIPLISSYASFKLAQTKLIETLREELAANGINGIRTTVVYLSILRGGLANGFEDSYKMTDDVYIMGEVAAESILKGVVRNKEVIYVPKIQWFYVLIKYLVSGRFLGMFVRAKAKINPKYLKLKAKLN